MNAVSSTFCAMSIRCQIVILAAHNNVSLKYKASSKCYSNLVIVFCRLMSVQDKSVLGFFLITDILLSVSASFFVLLF